MTYEEIIAKELNLSLKQTTATIQLLSEGSTIPFIARYRKEVTGSLEDFTITSIRDRLQQLKDLDARRDTILKSISEQGKLTPELEKKIKETKTLTQLEDLYLPYKPKRKTRASIAKEKGLEPLALKLLDQTDFDVEAEASKFINNEKEVATTEDALKGARDIIAETINEDAEVRQKVRDLFMKKGTISSKVMKNKEKEAEKYKDYFEWEEPIDKIPSHRLLAIRRGEKEMFLSLSITPEEEDALNILEKKYIKNQSEASAQVAIALKDSYKRLMKLSIETEVRLASKRKADEEAIKVFAENLNQLLMAAPLGQKTVMAVDPGFRTGCKVVCLDKQGKLLEFVTIYPNAPQKEIGKSGAIIENLVKKHEIEAIAIGNGTASRETEHFVKSLDLPKQVITAMINESGASIYSASEVAREEFPDHDITVRGAVSIGRRMIDPLSELVKIDAKSIGVGQYQHDVDQSLLKKSLDDVVEKCVNNVGVELNTASKELLTYVSGLGAQIAKNIIQYRNENGPFESRTALKKVPRLGEKAFEQAAGFLRINDAKNLLDRSAVHPERYNIVKKMAEDAKCTISDLMQSAELRKKIDIKKYVTDDVGLPTLKDIIDELNKPGRDPREKFEVFQFTEGVNEISDLREGMKLNGIVTNITKFGAFVDIGVHQDGLVHVSQLANRFVSDPTQVVKLGQKVTVTVTEVDANRKRIALSMKNGENTNFKKKKREESSGNDFASKLQMLKGKFNQ